MISLQLPTVIKHKDSHIHTYQTGASKILWAIEKKIWKDWVPILIRKGAKKSNT